MPTISQPITPDELDIMACVLDMTLRDAATILKTSVSRMRHGNKKMGNGSWPFSGIKEGNSRYTWDSVCIYRRQKLKSASGELRAILEKAATRGALNRIMFDESMPKDYRDSLMNRTHTELGKMRACSAAASVNVIDASMLEPLPADLPPISAEDNFEF